MFEITKYISSSGNCPINDFLQSLTNNGKIEELKKIQDYVNLLQEYGYILPSISSNYAKPLGDGIYELRPSKNRVLYFYCASDEKYVLLHGFRKKTQKTPPKQITQAKNEAKEYERMIKNGN